jgi:hypothetical protein
MHIHSERSGGERNVDTTWSFLREMSDPLTAKQVYETLSRQTALLTRDNMRLEHKVAELEKRFRSYLKWFITMDIAAIMIICEVVYKHYH